MKLENDEYTKKTIKFFKKEFGMGFAICAGIGIFFGIFPVLIWSLVIFILLYILYVRYYRK